MINKMNMPLDKIAHGIRSPTSKYFLTVPMLIANGYDYLKMMLSIQVS